MARAAGLRAATGFVLGGVPAVAMTYLAEEIDPRSVGFAMGLYVGGTAFGGMAGRVGTGILTEFFGWRYAMVSSASSVIAAAIGFVALLPPSRNFVRRTGFDPAFHLRRGSHPPSSPGLHGVRYRLPAHGRLRHDLQLRGLSPHGAALSTRARLNSA